MTKQATKQVEVESDRLSVAVSKSAIQRALLKIGKSNGHACPSDHAMDKLLHELLVAQEGQKFFEEMKKSTLEQINSDFSTVIKNIEPGTTGVVGMGSLYMLMLQVKNAASRLDTTKFITELRKLGVEQELIEEARENATTKSKPAQQFTVVSV
jgi:hypothetical protein